MIKFCLFFILFSVNTFAFTPNNRDEIFISAADKEKAMACNKRYLNFRGNHRLFSRIDRKLVCTCDDIDKLDYRILAIQSKFLEHNLMLSSKLSVACSKNIWICLNVTEDKKFESARTADEYCSLVDAIIDQEFKTSYSSPELKAALMSAPLGFNAIKRSWGKLACEGLLPKAKLDPACAARKGGGEGSESNSEELH